MTCFVPEVFRSLIRRDNKGKCVEGQMIVETLQ